MSAPSQRMLEYKSRRKAIPRGIGKPAREAALADLAREFPDEAAFFERDSKELAQMLNQPRRRREVASAPVQNPPPAPMKVAANSAPKRIKGVKVGDLETPQGQKTVAEFFRERRAVIDDDVAATMDALVSRIKGNDSDATRADGVIVPSRWVVKALGQSQLSPAAIEWVLRASYAFPAPWERHGDEGDSLSEALFQVAREITLERFIYLPASGKAFRISDQTLLDEGAAVADLQAWFGVSEDERKIKRWLRAKCRRADVAVRLPGRPMAFDFEGRAAVNLWTPPPWPEFAVTDADVQPFLDLVDYIAGAEAPLLLDYMGHHINAETAGAHTRWGWIIISREHQTGKEALAKIFARALGFDNMTRATREELGGKAETGAFLDRGTMILLSETRINYEQLERVKEISGSEEALLRLMNKNNRGVPHGAFFWIVSNQADCVALDVKNQRFMVVSHVADRRDESFYEGLRKWEAEGGPAKLCNWLRQRGAERKINPSVRPYATEAELELIDSAAGPVVADIRALISSRSAPFASELIEIDAARRAIAEGVVIDDGGGATTFRREVSPFHIQRALESCGAVNLGQQRISETQRARLWALGHAEEWAALSGDVAPAMRAAGMLAGSYDEAVTQLGGPSAPVIQLPRRRL